MRQMAGYRNRWVHFYDETSGRELYEICKNQMDDIETLLDTFINCFKGHPEMMDKVL